MDIEKYIVDLGDISDLGQLKSYFIDQLPLFGASYASGYPLHFGDEAEPWSPYVSNFSSEIRKLYEHRGSRHSPFMEATFVKGGPVQYSQVKDRLHWDEQQANFISNLSECNVNDAVGSPVSPKPGVLVFFVMMFPDVRPAMSWSELRRIHVFFSEFFVRYWELTRQFRPQISSRERQILMGIMRGKSKTEISEQLGLSVHTVDTYTRRCFEKLEAKNKTEAAIKAFGLGLAYVDSAINDLM